MQTFESDNGWMSSSFPIGHDWLVVTYFTMLFHSNSAGRVQDNRLKTVLGLYCNKRWSSGLLDSICPIHLSFFLSLYPFYDAHLPDLDFFSSNHHFSWNMANVLLFWSIFLPIEMSWSPILSLTKSFVMCSLQEISSYLASNTFQEPRFLSCSSIPHVEFRILCGDWDCWIVKGMLRVFE